MQKFGIFVSSLKHQVWRRYYYFFHKDEIPESIKNRKGTCKRCGLCCQASIRCPKLAYDENGLALCKIHDHKPYMCTIYPFNGQDFFKHLKDKCGYWYDPPSLKKKIDKKLQDITRSGLYHERY